MTTIGVAWRQARAGRTVRPARTPLLLMLAAWAGAHLPTWGKARSAVMQTAAFGALSYAAFQYSTITGWVTVGVSLLILEALTGAPRSRR